MLKKPLFVLVLAASFFCLSTFLTKQNVWAASCSWNGSADSNWSNSSNWDPGCSGASGIPGNGDTLTFPDSVSNLTNTNDISGLSLDTIIITGPHYDISGNSISLSSGIQESMPSPFSSLDFRLPITLTADITIQSTFRITLSGNINLNGHQLQFQSNGGLPFVSGDISGNGNVVATQGAAILSGNNSFVGGLIMDANSSFTLGSSTAAGDSSNLISSTGDQASLVVDSGAGTIPNDISLVQNANISNSGANNTLSGHITIDTSLVIRSDAYGSNNLNVTGVISGSGNLGKAGVGSVAFAGSSSNTYTGTFQTQEGPTYLAKTGSAVALPTGAIVGSNGMGGSLILNASDQIVGPIEILSDGTFDLNGFSQTVGNSLTGNGALNLPLGSEFFVTAGSDISFDGQINGGGEIQKDGAGAFTLTADSPSFTGNVTAAEGPLVINANIGNGTASLTGGTIGGTGTIGNFSGGNGTMWPGSLNSTGTLNVNGDLSLTSIITYNVLINGSNINNYSNVISTGNINLNNAVLNVTFGYTPTLGSHFTILKSTGGTISGTFNGLQNLSTITIGGKHYLLVYTDTEVSLSLPLELYMLSYTSSASTATYGTNITLTIQWGSNGVTPTGTTTFKDGDIELGVIPMSNGQASMTLSNLYVGTHHLSAMYSGDNNFHGAITGAILAITIIDPTVTVTPVVVVNPPVTPKPISYPTSFATTFQQVSDTQDSVTSYAATKDITSTASSLLTVVEYLVGIIVIFAMGRYLYKKFGIKQS